MSLDKEDNGNEGSRAAPAVETPAGGPGVAVPAGQRVKDDDPALPPAGEGLRALSERIMELLSAVTVLVGQLGKEAPVEGVANLGHIVSESGIATDPDKTAWVENRVESMVTYGSRVLAPAEQRNCVTRRELLAIVRFVQQYWPYRYGTAGAIATAAIYNNGTHRLLHTLISRTASLYWVMLVLVSVSRQVLGCPSGCKCAKQSQQDGLDVDCGDQRMKSVPSKIPSDASTIKLANNEITNIGANAFQNLNHLKNIHLESNHISGFDSRAFAGAKSLQMINLYGNNIRSLPSKAFQGVPSLKYLILGKNGILSFTSSTFQGLSDLSDLDMPMNNITSLPALAFQHTPSLVILDLAYNKIQQISPKAFVGLKNLDYLNLDNNKITTIAPGTLQSLQKLEMLVLNNNKIKRVTSSTFKGLTNLRELYFSNNMVSVLTKDAFNSNIKLTQLTISDNKVKVIEAGTFSTLSGLEMIYLHGNPYHCDCKLNPLVQWLATTKTKILPNSVMKCYTPKTMQDKRLQTLKSTDLQC
ncbi:unnamed protein product [Lampetra fluviatilis]